MKRNRIIVGAYDALSFVLIAGVLSLAWITPAYAYVDPSVMTYTIQALAGVAVALSAVLGTGDSSPASSYSAEIILSGE